MTVLGLKLHQKARLHPWKAGFLDRIKLVLLRNYWRAAGAVSAEAMMGDEMRLAALVLV
jgi:hypothetical protein